MFVLKQKWMQDVINVITPTEMRRKNVQHAQAISGGAKMDGVITKSVMTTAKILHNHNGGMT